MSNKRALLRLRRLHRHELGGLRFLGQQQDHAGQRDGGGQADAEGQDDVGDDIDDDQSGSGETRHPRAGGDPVVVGAAWIPACAGMTLRRVHCFSPSRLERHPFSSH
ncbi:MAG: hypothetical protein M5R42_15085 [Rhodocyclaceae bacterium]|nr:hypothetical protein [Rhodocyclaceae bacterium]